jgi:hypothetical protein
MDGANKFRFFQLLLISCFLNQIYSNTKSFLNDDDDDDDDKRVFDPTFADGKTFHIDDCIPLAFGDFNADRIVDIFCRNTEGNTIRVMLNDDRSPTSKEQCVVNIPYVTIIITLSNLYIYIQCLSRGIIYDALAGDYDGDSKLDLFILYKTNSSQNGYNGGFLWGDRIHLSKYRNFDFKATNSFLSFRRA